MLGCSGEAQDSIEHYCRCPTVKKAGAKILRLPPQAHSLQFFVLADRSLADDSLLTRVALLIYAVFSVTNLYRNSGPTIGVVAQDAIEEFVKLSTRGHPRSLSLLETLWCQ